MHVVHNKLIFINIQHDKNNKALLQLNKKIELNHGITQCTASNGWDQELCVHVDEVISVH